MAESNRSVRDLVRVLQAAAGIGEINVIVVDFANGTVTLEDFAKIHR